MHLRERLNIPDGAFVLEIGGGGDPHPRSSVLVDKFPYADGERQRGGDPLAVGARALIQADGSRLPFRDRQFDYVIASHVIEHVPAPDVFAFVRELQRVAPRGYIEAPSVVYERLRSIPEHLWFSHLDGGVVHLAARGQLDAWASLTEPLFADVGFRADVRRLAELFFVGMEWEETLSVEVHDSLDQLVATIPTEWATTAICEGNAREQARDLNSGRFRRAVRASLPPVLARRLHAAARRVDRPDAARPVNDAVRSGIVSWRSLVVCPACRGELTEVSAHLRCRTCQREYEVNSQDVPCLLPVQNALQF